MFGPARRDTIADRIAAQIRSAILGGRWTPGETLPSERDLAEQFAVNRSTVREALHRVESLGLVESKHGEGTRVRDFILEAGLELLPYLLAPAGAPDRDMIVDLLELRVMLLGWTARTAAERSTQEGAQKLANALSDLREAETADEIQRLDFVFFEVLAQMTGNKALGLLSNAVRSVYLENRALFAVLYQPRFDLTDHEATLDAICRKDGNAAAKAMTRCAQRALDLMRPPPPSKTKTEREVNHG